MEVRTETGRFATGSGAAWGWSEDIGTYALAAAVNSLAAKEAVCLGVEAQILFPPRAGNSKAYALERSFRKSCMERGIDQVTSQVRFNPLTSLPVVTVLAGGAASEADSSADAVQMKCGRRRQAEDGRASEEGKGLPDIRPGGEIVLVKWIGMEGMLRIAGEKGEELGERFAPVFIRQIQSRRKEIFAGKELEIARRAGAPYVRQITEGGILAALWELAKNTGFGLDVDMKRMSVLQETIEVCEQYRLNPYQLTSVGSFLMVSEDGNTLAEALRRNRIHASVIGHLTEGNDKIIHNGGETRYLDRPAPDELYKILL